MSLTIVAEIGTIVSATGVAMIGVFPVIPTLAMMDSELEQGLYHGTTQVVMAVFIIMLSVCVISLFTILMKTIDKGHKERDDREHRFSDIVVKMELALQKNTEASIEATKVMHECVHSMADMEEIGKACMQEQAVKKVLNSIPDKG